MPSASNSNAFEIFSSDGKVISQLLSSLLLMIGPHCLFGFSQRLLMILLFQELQTCLQAFEASTANEEHDVVKQFWRQLIQLHGRAERDDVG